MKKRKIQSSVLLAQKQFIDSRYTHTAYIGGYRSGKTFSGVRKTTAFKLANKGIPVAYYMPTYGLINDVAYPEFTRYLDELNIWYKLNVSRHEFDTDWGKIFLRSMDDPSMIIGYEVCYSCMDEVDVLPYSKMKTAFSKVIARNSAKTELGYNITDVVSTPEGFGFAYNMFVKEQKKNRLLIQVKTENNPHISDNYIKTLEETYSDEQLKAYLGGEFVNLTSGSVYRDYNRKTNHTNRTVKAHDKLHIGMDFNITNMNAVVHVIDENIKMAVDEITHAYDTMAMIRIIKDKFEGHSIIIYPDASGQNRSTSGRSDLELLKYAGFVLRNPNKNPFIRDRVNAMNKGFRDKTYLVNSHNCPEYTEALEKIAYNNGEPDKHSGFDHITDAGGYFAHRINIASFTI